MKKYLTIPRVLNSKSQGFSLVELMIAMTIGLVVLVALGYVFIGSRQSFRTTDAMSRIQENARYALQSMSQNIRMVGFSGCGNLLNLTVYPVPPAAVAPAPALTSLNMISGQDASAAPAVINTIVRPAGDTLTIFGAFSSPVSIVGTAAAGAVPVNGNPYGFKVGDILLATNCVSANVFSVAGLSPATATTPIGTTVTFTPGANLQGSYIANTNGDPYVMKLDQYTYFVGVNPSGGRSLYRSSLNDGIVELVENVWDMQVLYGYDSTNSGAASAYFSAANVPAWTGVVSVRINLLMVSADKVLSGPQTYQYFADAATTRSATTPVVGAADYLLLHQVFTTTVGLRNRLP